MLDIWTWLTVSAAPVVVLELYTLHRYRRTVRSDLRPPLRVRPDASGPVPGMPSCDSFAAAAVPATAGEAILCVDPLGRCTAANLAAHRLLQRSPEQTMLGECLRGAAQILASVVDEGVVERDAVVSTLPCAALFHIRAVALRDRDNNFWGAAVFIRPPALTAGGAASQLLPH